jgi:hypothetical protein
MLKIVGNHFFVCKFNDLANKKVAVGVRTRCGLNVCCLLISRFSLFIHNCYKGLSKFDGAHLAA